MYKIFIKYFYCINVLDTSEQKHENVEIVSSFILVSTILIMEKRLKHTITISFKQHEKIEILQ